MNPLDLLAPPRCVFCGCWQPERANSICAACFDDLPWRPRVVEKGRGRFVVRAAPLSYAFPLDAAIKALKFNRKLHYLPAFAELLRCALPELPDDIDVIVPVPLNWRRKFVRGFNQATELARPVARELDVPMERLAKRVKATPFQSGLSASERRKNLRFAFRVPRPLTSQHVLIVDDVVTTGATANALAAELLREGAAKTSLLTLARVTGETG